MFKKKLISSLVILSCISMMLIVSPQVKGVQFHIAGWSYPDEYGQGVYVWYVESNATGSWVNFAWGYENDAGDSHDGAIQWTSNQAMRISVRASMNRTLLGLNSTELGRNYIQHNITVTNSFHAVVFSQQNFTILAEQVIIDIYWYLYGVILDFLPLEGESYTVTILTEIYYGD